MADGAACSLIAVSALPSARKRPPAAEPHVDAVSTGRPDRRGLGRALDLKPVLICPTHPRFSTWALLILWARAFLNIVRSPVSGTKF